MRSKLTVQDLEAEMTNFVRVLDQARRIGLQKAALLTQVRGTADVRELARTRARDGVEAVTTLNQSAVVLNAGAKSALVQADLKAGDLASRIKPEQTAAMGRVIGERGLPAAGVKLRVTTDAGATIAEATVDDSGLFVIQMTRAEFDRRAEKTANLNIAIFNTAGALVRRAQFPFQPGAGVMVWNFDLTTPLSHPPPPSDTPPPTNLKDVKGLGPIRISKLMEMGVTEVGVLAGFAADEIAKALKIAVDQAQDIIDSAKDLRRDSK